MSALVEAEGLETLPPLESIGALSFTSSRIDVHAQYALTRLGHGSNAARWLACFVMSSTVNHALAGIFKDDTKAPTLRALRHPRMSWYTDILADTPDPWRLWDEPAGDAPMLVFSNRIRSNAAKMDEVVARGWLDAGFGGMAIQADPHRTLYYRGPGGIAREASTGENGLLAISGPPGRYSLSSSCLAPGAATAGARTFSIVGGRFARLRFP